MWQLVAGLRSSRIFEKMSSSRVVKIRERVKGIEPSSIAWEAIVLPLYYTRNIKNISRLGRAVMCLFLFIIKRC